MPKKVAIGIFAILVAAVLIVNWYVAGIIEGRIEDQLERLTSQLPPTVSFTYSDLSVTPIFAEASLEKIRFEDRVVGKMLRCGELTVGCTYRDLIAMARRQEIEEIHGLDVTMKELDFESGQGEEDLSMGRLAVSFDGYLSPEMFGIAIPSLPEESQRLEISIEDLKVDDPDLFRGMALRAEKTEKITTIDRASLSLLYDPQAKEVRVENARLRAPIGSMDLSGTIRYGGSHLLNLRPEAVRIDMDCEFTPSGIYLGDPRESGQYSLEELKVKSALEFDIGGPVMLEIPLPRGTASLAIEGLAAQFSGRSRQQLERSPMGLMSNMAMDEITVDRFSANYSYENGRLVLSDVEMITAFLKAFLDVEIDVDESDPDNSVIQTARLTLRDVTDDVMGAFVSLEKMTGKSFRSDERELVIAVGGTIGNPVLKSVGEVGAAPEQERKLSSEEAKYTRQSREVGEVETGSSGSIQGEETPTQPPTGARISSVDPSRLVSGRRTALVLSGGGLKGATAVAINRTATVENPPQVNADGSRLTVYITVPPGQSAGPAVVTVYTPQGNPQAEVMIEELPSIESVVPPELRPGNRTLVAIRGRNLGGAMAVTTDMAAVVENPPVVSPDGTSLTVYITLSEGQVGGPVTLTVVSPQGNATGTIALAQEAGVSSVEPRELVLGRRSVVTITGKNLQGAIELTMDRNAVIENPPAVLMEGSKLEAAVMVPEGETPGPATMTVHTPQGNPTIGISLVEPPKITSIEPGRIILGIRESITIRGTDLQDADRVSMDREAVIDNPPKVNPEGTELTVSVTVPEGQAPGASTITVHTKRGDPSEQITLVERADITSVRPSKITLGERTSMTIQGKNLQGATKVSLNRSADVGNPPSVDPGGTKVSFSLSVPEGQKTGSATLTVHTPQGAPTARVTLVEQPKGALFIDANIRGGECYIDGEKIGTKTVPNYVKLPPGPHTVKIVQPSCSPGVFVYDVEVIVDKEVQKFFELDCR